MNLSKNYIAIDLDYFCKIMAGLYRMGNHVGEDFVTVTIMAGTGLIGIDLFQAGQDLSHFAHRGRRAFIAQVHEVAQTEINVTEKLSDEDLMNLHEKFTESEYYMHIVDLGFKVSGIWRIKDDDRYNYMLFIKKNN